MPGITACLIAKDEQQHIGRCLASLAGQVDEIVLVDTGSSDDTVQIAREHGAQVYHLPWQNDFSLARNHGLDRASADWILYIDADEALSTDGAPLTALMPERGTAAAARLRFRPRLNCTPYMEYRLVPRDPRIRFQGSMHESMLPGIQRVAEEDGLGIVDLTGVELVHYGYEGDLTAKHHRNEPLLRQAIREVPDRVYLRYHLGWTLWRLGRGDEAVEPLLVGLSLAEQPGADMQERVEGSECARVLGEVRIASGDMDGALAAIDRGVALFAENRVLMFLKGKCLGATGRESEAIDILAELASHDPEAFFDPRIAYDRDVFGAPCHALLGTLAFGERRYDLAARAFAQAAALADDPREFAVKAEVARARSAGPGEGVLQRWTT